MSLSLALWFHSTSKSDSQVTLIHLKLFYTFSYISRMWPITDDIRWEQYCPHYVLQIFFSVIVNYFASHFFKVMSPWVCFSLLDSKGSSFLESDSFWIFRHSSNDWSESDDLQESSLISSFSLNAIDVRPELIISRWMLILLRFIVRTPHCQASSLIRFKSLPWQLTFRTSFSSLSLSSSDNESIYATKKLSSPLNAVFSFPMLASVKVSFSATMLLQYLKSTTKGHDKTDTKKKAWYACLDKKGIFCFFSADLSHIYTRK